MRMIESKADRDSIDRRRRALVAAFPALLLAGRHADAASSARGPVPGSATAAGAATTGGAGAAAVSASSAALTVPVVDRLTLHIIVDAQAFAFAEPVKKENLIVERAGPRGNDTGPPRETLAAEFGFSLLGESRRGDETRRVMVDAGYTPEALANNLRQLHLDPATFDALVLSHGHYDHFGGLPALLSGPLALRRGTPVYVGGEEIFCARDTLVRNVQLPFGQVDREALAAAGLKIESHVEPAIVAGHALSTGRIPLTTSERTVNPTLMRPGEGCRRDLLDADKQNLTVVADDLRHEIATAWVVKDRGLVVSSSCSHRGVLNAVRRAQELSGVERVHAVIGGFHLVWPRIEAEALETAAALEKISPDYVIPMHCTGEKFIEEAQRRLPGRVIRPYVGSRFVFGAV
jgi:7,8-dihydropterin-6-yl-methyl-4-(beta-D-ribofuranosyl)aminobenzene 5'-phosphate synthase